MNLQQPLNEQRKKTINLKRDASNDFEPACKKKLKVSCSLDNLEHEMDSLAVGISLGSAKKDTPCIDHIEHESSDAAQALSIDIEALAQESAAPQAIEIDQQPGLVSEQISTINTEGAQRSQPTIEEILESPLKIEDFDLSQSTMTPLFNQSQQLPSDQSNAQSQHLNTQSLDTAANALTVEDGFRFLHSLVEEALAASALPTPAEATGSNTDTSPSTPTTPMTASFPLPSLTPTPTSSPSTPSLPHTPKKTSPQPSTKRPNNQKVAPIAPDATLSAEEWLKKEAMHQKIRADNRERKKRWRLLNEERNKDNDLRCRVNKRAHKLFGKEDSEEKRKWVEEEFFKRQQKRKEKERIKVVVDDSLGVQQQLHNNLAAAAALNGLDLNTLLQNFSAPPSSAQTMPDVNLLALLLSNLPAANPIRTLLDAAPNNNTTATDNPSTAQSIEQGQQNETKQLLDQKAIEDSSNNNSSEPVASLNNANSLSQEDATNSTRAAAATLPQMLPLQLLELIQHLQQSQPMTATSFQHTTPSPVTDSATVASNPATTTQISQNQQQSDLSNTNSEDKLAILIASTLQATAAAAAAAVVASQQQQQQLPQASISEANDANHNETPNIQQEQQDHQQQEHQQQQSPQQQPLISGEYPLDAVLTLMQLNAGWRQ